VSVNTATSDAKMEKVQGKIELNGVMTSVDCDCSSKWKVWFLEEPKFVSIVTSTFAKFANSSFNSLLLSSLFFFCVIYSRKN
jgi:hypothetical protein